MCSIYNDPRDIRSYVLENLIDFAGRDDLIGWVQGSAVVDPNPLYKQISELTDQVRLLKGELSDAQVKQDDIKPKSSGDDGFSSLSKLLLSQKVTIPPEVSDSKEEIERSMLSLFVANVSNYVRGATVTTPTKTRTKWFEQNVYSVLVTHRLLSITSRTAAQRVYVITERGIDFAAWIDRTRHEVQNAKPKN